jgi:hypothetical protein
MKRSFQTIFKPRTFGCALALLISFLALTPADVIADGQLAGNGRITGSLALSSGGAVDAPGGSSGAGVLVMSTPGLGNSTDVVDFGDLTRGGGERIQASIKFRIRGNASYKLNISESSYNARTLTYRGRDVSGNSDRGSFVQVRVAAPTGSGARANVAGTAINGVIASGLTLDQISQGTVDAGSTNLSAGDAPSLGGTASSPDNAVELPIIFSVPSGLELGPSDRGPTGSFQISLELGVFAGR